MSLNTWMICGLALYVCFVVYVGFLGAKKIKGLSDFAVAGESMGPIPLGLAFAASFFSAATFHRHVDLPCHLLRIYPGLHPACQRRPEQ